jgi:hypothetical protein
MASWHRRVPLNPQQSDAESIIPLTAAMASRVWWSPRPSNGRRKQYGVAQLNKRRVRVSTTERTIDVTIGK